MDANGLLADEQVLADLAVGAALGDQREDLPLALTQAERIARSGSRAGDRRRRPGRGPTGAPLPSGRRGGVGTRDRARPGRAKQGFELPGSWMRARPASSRSARRSGRAPRSSAIRTASRSGSRAARPTGPGAPDGHDRLGLAPARERDLVRRGALVHAAATVPTLVGVVVAIQSSLEGPGGGQVGLGHLP